jgi:hypothetical protein
MDHLRSDDERMNWARERILSSGRDYLRGDYSKVLGDAELVAFKRRLIDHVMQGLTKDEQLVEFLDRGIAILRPKLLKAADELRTLGGRTTSIFLMGPSGIDNPEMSGACHKRQKTWTQKKVTAAQAAAVDSAT